jgi:hypothetical protein
VVLHVSLGQGKKEVKIAVGDAKYVTAPNTMGLGKRGIKA